jgi:hypothetical protein
LCHQSSNGADTSIAMPPHALMKAPSGPVKPQMRTLAAARTGALPRVVVTIM